MRVGHKVKLEPLEPPPFDVVGWWAALDELGASEFMVDGVPDDKAVEPDDAIEFG